MSKIAERNKYLDKAAEFIRMAQCFERGSNDYNRFINEARLMERLADKCEA